MTGKPVEHSKRRPVTATPIIWNDRIVNLVSLATTIKAITTHRIVTSRAVFPAGVIAFGAAIEPAIPAILVATMAITPVMVVGRITIAAPKEVTAVRVVNIAIDMVITADKMVTRVRMVLTTIKTVIPVIRIVATAVRVNEG